MVSFIYSFHEERWRVIMFALSGKICMARPVVDFHFLPKPYTGPASWPGKVMVLYPWLLGFSGWLLGLQGHIWVVFLFALVNFWLFWYMSLDLLGAATLWMAINEWFGLFWLKSLCKLLQNLRQTVLTVD